MSKTELTLKWPHATDEISAEQLDKWLSSLQDIMDEYDHCVGKELYDILKSRREESKKKDSLQMERLNKFCKRWNESKDILKSMMNNGESAFKVNQLLFQEIDMWIRIGKMVSAEEFKHMSDRRGFTPRMREYLFASLLDVGLIPEGFEEKSVVE